ncbi:MAG: c-type cytochrome [Thermoanaerobaculia bacterium]
MSARIHDGTRRSALAAFAVLLLLVAAAPGGAQIPDEFTNLQVLPKDIGKGQLVSTMRGFASALGVRCIHCHVGDDPNDLAGVDFVSDERQAKKTARVMVQMVEQINGELLPRIGKESPRQVSCVTCHRRLSRPETVTDVLMKAIDESGVEDALEQYRQLRDEYYGQGVYDFSPRPLNRTAETLARQRQDLDGALTVMRLSVELHPEDAYTQLMLGQLLAQNSDPAGARAAIERSLAIEPDNPWARRLLESVSEAAAEE